MKICVYELTKKYGTRTILEDFNLNIQSESFVIITGKSGCGKTTLLKCMMGVEPYESGKVYYDDYALDDNGDALRNGYFGYVSQNDHLLDEVKVSRQIRLNASISGVDFDDEWYEYLINTLRIGHLVHKYPLDCSIGERQRIALACALIKKPKVLFLDEPTGSLDEKNTAIFMDVLTKMYQENPCTILMVSHETSLLKYATKVVDLTSFQKESVEIPISKKLTSKPNKKTWMFRLMNDYHNFHRWKMVAYVICLTILFISVYLAVDAGTEFKHYITNEVKNDEKSMVVRVEPIDGKGFVNGNDYDEMMAIPYVTNLDYQTMGFRYAFERIGDKCISLEVDGQKISDKELPLFFHGRENMMHLVSGVQPSQSNLVLTEVIVEALGYTKDSILNKKITYSFPYVVGYQPIQVVDPGLNYDVNNSYIPQLEMMRLEGTVVGVSSGEFADIYHDEAYISQLVLDKIEDLPSKEGLLPPLSAGEVLLSVDTFDHVSRVIQRVEAMGYRCENNYLNLSMMIGNLDKISSIYKFILIFVFVCMLVVCKILFDFMDQSKIVFTKHLKHMGVTKQQMRSYIVKDHLFLFAVVSLFSILCLFLMMPLIDRMFYFVNGLIFQMQLEANKAVPIFTFSWKHILLCVLLTGIVIGVAGYQFYRRARRCDLC